MPEAAEQIPFVDAQPHDLRKKSTLPRVLTSSLINPAFAPVVKDESKHSVFKHACLLLPCSVGSHTVDYRQ